MFMPPGDRTLPVWYENTTTCANLLCKNVTCPQFQESMEDIDSINLMLIALTAKQVKIMAQSLLYAAKFNSYK